MIYIVRTLDQDCQEVPERTFNITNRDQKLTRGFPLANCEPVLMVTPPGGGQPQTQDLGSKLEESV
jgi:hypothetical protein